METIDEVMVRSSANNRYDLEFIEEADCEGDESWTQLISESHSGQRETIMANDISSQSSPSSDKVHNNHEKTVDLNKATEYRYSTDANPEPGNNDVHKEDYINVQCSNGQDHSEDGNVTYNVGSSKIGDSDSDSDSKEGSEAEYFEDAAAERERILKLFEGFPANIRAVKPLISKEDTNYGTMDIIQNPWSIIDEGDLPHHIKDLLVASISEFVITYPLHYPP